jgi:glycosyltransferase involved in cell wall biosynthesis
VSRRRLLVVSPRFLFPANEGGKIRTVNTLRHMRGGAFEIILASPAPADLGPYAADIAMVCDRFVSWPASRLSRAGRVGALFGRLPVAVASDRSRAGRAVVGAQLAEQPDLVVVDFPHAMVLLPDRQPRPPLIVFAHNVEAEIFERHAAVAAPGWRFIWRDQARKMRAFEGAALRQARSVIAVSERDAIALRRDYALDRVTHVNTGVDLDYHRFMPPATPAAGGGTVVFCGAMDWQANVDGIAFLMDAVWPLLLRDRPQIRAVIVGRNPPKSLAEKAAKRGVAFQFTGYVDDIRDYVAAADVYVIPLRVGSGTRIKAYEAMATGRPVVSTSVGIEGLAVQPEQHFLVADDAETFAASILRLLDDAALRTRLCTAAHQLLEEHFSWQQVARQFEAECLSAVG